MAALIRRAATKALNWISQLALMPATCLRWPLIRNQPRQSVAYKAPLCDYLCRAPIASSSSFSPRASERTCNASSKQLWRAIGVRQSGMQTSWPTKPSHFRRRGRPATRKALAKPQTAPTKMEALFSRPPPPLPVGRALFIGLAATLVHCVHRVGVGVGVGGEKGGVRCWRAAHLPKEIHFSSSWSL